MSRGLRRGRGGAAAAGVGRYTEKERERECRRLGKKTTDIHSWNRRTGKIRLVLFSFAPSLF